MINDKDVTPAVLPKIKSIREYTEAGYTLIPLNGKIPAVENWVETAPGKYGEKELAASNYGVALRAGDLVVDIDPRNITEADNKPVARLVKDIACALKSYTVRTGGGGLHIYFRKPADVLVSNTVKAYGKGIEFKSAGRQVVGPGSIHPDSKKEYTVVSGSPLEIADAPAALIALIKKTAVPYADLDKGTGDYRNDAETQGRYVSYLQHVAEPSVTGQGGDVNAFKVAAHGRDLGLPPSTVLELLMDIWNPRCAPAWDLEELKAKVFNAYRYAQGPVGNAHPEADFTVVPMPPKKEKEPEIIWDLTANGGVRKSFSNLLNYLRLPSAGMNKGFGYNEFTGTVEVTNPLPWHKGIMPRHPSVTDQDLKLLKGHLAVQHAFEMTVGSIEEAVTNAAHGNKFHPIREDLIGFKWDGKERLNTWLHDYCGADNTPYTQAVARKTLCAAVMRVFKPGCKFDHALVLEGEQGIGKSGICAILGGPWAGDFAIDPHNKDTVQLMQGKWIIELAELEVSNRADADALKAFISRQTDTARLAYGRLAMEFPRQSIFIASKNPGADGTYLKDDTGNRRWWPVELKPAGGMVNFRGLKEVRDQLFAEAVVRMKAGEKLFMDTPELKESAKDVVEVRHAEHPWLERIATWVTTLPATTDFLTSRDVFIDALGGIDKQFDRRTTIAIAGVMRTLGWTSSFKRVGERTVRGYSRDAGIDNIMRDLI